MGQSHYEEQRNRFSLLIDPKDKGWRSPQIGALGAILAHWSLDASEPALISMPTGSGKTAVALALPYLAKSHRVLVVVPSRELRRQIASEFRSQTMLQGIGALEGDAAPSVHEWVGRQPDWSSLDAADVVVAIPASISPSHFSPDSVPQDFFDLIVVDEAHHSPAKTWFSILEFFSQSKAVLLTATPRRRDGKPLPGKHIFHFPLSKAIKEGIYKPIEPQLVPGTPGSSADVDERIAREVQSLLLSSSHTTSSVLIRANNIKRAEGLADLYSRLGMQPKVVHSKLKAADVKATVAAWRAGSLQSVIAVDMLGEGIDLPSLRIVAYHDKHKSSPATMQMIGRLARVNKDFPQPSVLVAARASDAFSDLTQSMRSLYEEDAEWSDLLPKFVDADIEAKEAARNYLKAFTPSAPSVKLQSIAPPARVVILEARSESTFEPSFVQGQVPDVLKPGARVGGSTIEYAGVSESGTTLLLVTSQLSSPRWYVGASDLDAPAFDLHVLTWHKAAQTGYRNLLLVNSANLKVSSAIREIVDPAGVLRSGDPSSMQGVFDANDRLSVSSVGVRNTYAGTPGTPSYAMFSGADVERGLREADTNNRALGHAIAQIAFDEHRTTAGFSAGKAKYWETRNISLPSYEVFVSALADRFWYPKSSSSGLLLPQVARGKRTDAFPNSRVLVVEMNPKLIGRAWTLPDGRPLESLELQPGADSDESTESITVDLVDPRSPEEVIWRGSQDVRGRFASTGHALVLNRGSGLEEEMPTLLNDYPPNVYFLNGQTIHGGVVYDVPDARTELPPITYTRDWDWSGTTITKESKKEQTQGTIHHLVENQLNVPHERGELRWVLCNDGKGEIADHIVIRLRRGERPLVELWHSKFSAKLKPSVRVNDMEVLVQQAIKNRRHLVDRNFWRRLGKRLNGQEAPALHLVSGDSRRILEAICGLDADHTEWSYAERPPIVQGRIVLVQPGLSLGQLRKQLHKGTNSPYAGHVREFLTVLHNSAQALADVELISSQ